MLDGVKAREVRLALISNTDGTEVESWSECPLAPYFEVVVFSHDVGYMKPDPEIYRAALSDLDLEASDCWYAGDGGSSELSGAGRVGMKPHCATWFLDRHREVYDPGEVAARTANHPVLRRPQDLLRALD